MTDTVDIQPIHLGEPLDAARFGARSVRLSQLAVLGLPVPEGVVLSVNAVREIAELGIFPEFPAGLCDGLVSVRGSAPEPEWGGPTAVLNIGICDAIMPDLIKKVGELGAYTLYRRFIQSFSTNVMGLDAEVFDGHETDGAARIAHCKAAYLAEVDQAFPQDPMEQLRLTLKHMAEAWNRPTARILREAKGAPLNAGIALIVQRMALGIGQGVCGAGAVQMVDDVTGAPRLWGRFLPQSQGQDALIGGAVALPVCGDTGSLEAQCPAILAEFMRLGKLASAGFGEALQFEFTLENGVLSILDATPAKRNARAAVRIAVDLAEAGAISRNDALLRIEPRSLIEHLHPQIAPNAARDVFSTGLPASPGAAIGRIVFTPEAAMASAARGEACILVRHETSPEDIRG
ncbi:MAG: pyruvate, phosphate dikinase, partial [Rhodobacteraceae bacterium]|nr:pyruvate, phosphate dikinase [Paracoccaceae bacterium]